MKYSDELESDSAKHALYALAQMMMRITESYDLTPKEVVDVLSVYTKMYVEEMNPSDWE